MSWEFSGVSALREEVVNSFTAHSCSLAHPVPHSQLHSKAPCEMKMGDLTGHRWTNPQKLNCYKGRPRFVTSPENSVTKNFPKPLTCPFHPPPKQDTLIFLNHQLHPDPEIPTRGMGKQSSAEHSPGNKTFARVLLTSSDRQHFLHQDLCFYLLGVKGLISLYAQRYFKEVAFEITVMTNQQNFWVCSVSPRRTEN